MTSSAFQHQRQPLSPPPIVLPDAAQRRTGIGEPGSFGLNTPETQGPVPLRPRFALRLTGVTMDKRGRPQ